MELSRGKSDFKSIIQTTNTLIQAVQCEKTAWKREYQRLGWSDDLCWTQQRRLGLSLKAWNLTQGLGIVKRMKGLLHHPHLTMYMSQKEVSEETSLHRYSAAAGQQVNHKQDSGKYRALEPCGFSIKVILSKAQRLVRVWKAPRKHVKACYKLLTESAKTQSHKSLIR